MRRRTLLGSVAAIVGSVAGCTGFGSGGDSLTPRTATTRDTDTEVERELDLREANVLSVAIEERRRLPLQRGAVPRRSRELCSRAAHQKSLISEDDDGEDGYADWWQVETLDGDRLGRRELRHAHSTEPFVRSETIAIPDGVDRVVVRGHDQTHGYGGQAMLVSVPGGETATAGQGSDQQSFEESDCP